MNEKTGYPLGFAVVCVGEGPFHCSSLRTNVIMDCCICSYACTIAVLAFLVSCMSYSFSFLVLATMLDDGNRDTILQASISPLDSTFNTIDVADCVCEFVPNCQKLMCPELGCVWQHQESTNFMY